MITVTDSYKEEMVSTKSGNSFAVKQQYITWTYKGETGVELIQGAWLRVEKQLDPGKYLLSPASLSVGRYGRAEMGEPVLVLASDLFSPKTVKAVGAG